MEIRRMFIDGEWRLSSSGQTREVKDPATGETVAVVAEADEQDLEDAVRAAREAFPAWRKTTPAQRAALMKKAVEIFTARTEEIALQESKHTGRLLRLCRGDVLGFKLRFDYYAEIADKTFGKTAVGPGENVIGREVYTPVGVVACITPWNSPINVMSNHVAPAIAAGNTVVMKPSSMTPLGAIEMVRAMEDAGFPKGVVNLIMGSGGEIGQKLAEHPGIDMVAFTGGTETGQDIIRASAIGIKRLCLELGGKSPVLVFEDGDIDMAIDHIMYSMYSSCGQICVAGSRAIVQEGVYDLFCKRLKERVEKIVVGDPLDPGTEMGPMISRGQRERVLRYIEIGKAEGAQLLCGGNAITEGIFAGGNYIQPTVFINVENSMRIAQEEIFGPVLCVEKFSTEEEAFAIANDVKYGLAAGIFTRDASRVQRFGQEVEASLLYANGYQNGSGFNLPIQCCKQSGYGMVFGIEGLQYFMNRKILNVTLNPKTKGFFRN